MQRARISPLPTPPVLPLSGEGRNDEIWRVRIGGLIGLFLKQPLKQLLIPILLFLIYNIVF
jgi:hypothetical protein